MKISIEYLSCGGPETIIDCFQHASFQCAFCKNYSSWFSETKEVTPLELVELINECRYIIKVVKDKPSKFEQYENNSNSSQLH
jgi:uncharacterized Fe-S radical SAM superfamily protein PflX